MEPIRVLVTGAGSGVGQGIVKALRASRLSITVIGADIAPMNAALYRTDEAVLIPKVEDPGSLEKIAQVLIEKKINVLMVGSEFEVEFFARHKLKLESETKTMIVVSALPSVLIADDKWHTVQFLKENNLPFADSICPQNLDEAKEYAKKLKFPLVLKTRTGTSNRHVHIIKSLEELESLFNQTPKPMLQKMIDLPSSQLKNEYTCSIFKFSNGSLSQPFTAKRVLRGGSSWVIEVAPIEEIYPLMYKIAEKLDFMGSLNVQLMIGADGPIPFEFNCRFSGTTAVRAHFGFNEPEMVILDYFLKKPTPNPVIRSGVAFRYLEEVFIEGYRAADLHIPLPKGEVRPWF